MFVAVILASAASSVPDTIISMNDARKGNYDDAISNALGSNIFDICFALGFPLFLFTLIHGPIHMHQEIIDMSSELRMLLLILTILAISVYVFSDKISVLHAVFLLGLYGVFSMYVIGRGLENEFTANIAHILQKLVGYIDIFK
jgi:cation:H+ antiporter